MYLSFLEKEILYVLNGWVVSNIVLFWTNFRLEEEGRIFNLIYFKTILKAKNYEEISTKIAGEEYLERYLFIYFSLLKGINIIICYLL